MDRPTCDTCRFFDYFDEGEGTCRRYAPRPRSITSEKIEVDPVGYWPSVALLSWCGEHQPKEQSDDV